MDTVPLYIIESQLFALAQIAQHLDYLADNYANSVSMVPASLLDLPLCTMLESQQILPFMSVDTRKVCTTITTICRADRTRWSQAADYDSPNVGSEAKLEPVCLRQIAVGLREQIMQICIHRRDAEPYISASHNYIKP